MDLESKLNSITKQVKNIINKVRTSTATQALEGAIAEIEAEYGELPEEVYSMILDNLGM